MDERTLEQGIAEELIQGWNISPTGDGFLVITDWHWPNNEHIEIYVRAVGEREDLYIVTDGGELFNFLFSHGIDLRKDKQALQLVERVVDNHEGKFVDFQMVRGANDTDLARSVRLMLEAIKDAACLLWHRLETDATRH